jgi:DNA-binding NtrC family response regulator
VSKHLLLVEDQAALSESLSRRLSRRGFQVSIAGNKDAALAVLRAGGIDLCVSDIDLTADGSGLEIYRTAQSEQLGVPFVFLSGHEENSASMQEALSLGARAVFTKPTDFTVLLEKVCDVLGLDAHSVSMLASK